MSFKNKGREILAKKLLKQAEKAKTPFQKKALENIAKKFGA